MMIPPSYLFPVDRLKHGPDTPPRQPSARIWSAAIVGGVSGGVVALLVSTLLA